MSGPRPEFAPRHPMRFVTRRTGLTPARLRIWERRYGVVRPGRTKGGQRLYSDDDIARLTLLARATEAGHALAQIARLPREALEALLARDQVAPPLAAHEPPPVDRLLDQVSRLDAPGLERDLRRAALSLGALPFAERVVAPLMHEIGARWHAGKLSPAHEHLASGAVRRVVAWLGDQFVVSDNAPALVVATPAGERHELGAALVAAAAAEAGWRVIYLGADLPAADIAAAAKHARARAVALSVVQADDPRAVGREIARIAGRLDGTALAVGGRMAEAVAPVLARVGARACGSLADLREFLSEQGKTHA